MKNSGRRDRPISIKQDILTAGDYGEPEVSSTLSYTHWAEVIYSGSASESVKAYQLYPERDVIFIIRHTNPTADPVGVNLSQDFYITFDSRNYDVLGFEEIGRRDGLRIYCKERGTR